MLRINKKYYKLTEWFHTLNDAIKKRDKCMMDIGE